MTQHDIFNQFWPCLIGEAIAKHAEVRELMHELKSLISAPAPIYTALYETTLWRLMEFCQAMPDDMATPQPYSLLKNALETAIAALKIRRGKMMPSQSNSETIAEQEALWTYAVFTASLITAIPDIHSDRTIELYKTEKEKIGLWHPISGCLYEPKTYYKILSQPHLIQIPKIFCLISICGKILPSIGYRWLAEKPETWSIWWEVITQTAAENNILWSLVRKVCPPTENNPTQIQPVPKVSSSIVKPEAVIQVEKNNATVIEPLSAELSNKMLADFNQWILRNCQPSGALNGKKTFMRVIWGVLIRQKRIADFIAVYPNYVSPENVLNQLSGYLKKEDNNPILHYHFIQKSGAAEDVVRGIVLLNSFLCEPLKVLPINNQFIENLTSTST